MNCIFIVFLLYLYCICIVYCNVFRGACHIIFCFTFCIIICNVFCVIFLLYFEFMLQIIALNPIVARQLATVRSSPQSCTYPHSEIKETLWFIWFIWFVYSGVLEQAGWKRGWAQFLGTAEGKNIQHLQKKGQIKLKFAHVARNTVKEYSFL